MEASSDSPDAEILLEDELTSTSKRVRPTIFLVLLALLTAMTTVATIIIVIPFPLTLGYFNLGDALVMTSGIILGPIGGLIAGGVGSALGDVALGWYVYAPITLVVKGGEGLIVGTISRYSKKSKAAKPWDILGIVLGAIFMLCGYYVGEVLVLGIPSWYALLELLTINSIQVIAGGIVSLLIGPILRDFLRTYVSE
ncbi:MAG: ECF transporter S component [Candidatus Thorarchaeota archaeon]